MFTSLFTNKLLYLNLTCLIIESKVRLGLDLFIKKNEQQVSSQAKSEMFINSLFHLHP